MQVVNLKLATLTPLPGNRPIAQNDIAELAESMRTIGLLNPITVRKGLKGHEVIAGERRLLAAKQLQWDEIACAVVEMQDEDADFARIVENLQRADLHPLDEASAFASLAKELSLDTIAGKIGKSEFYVWQRVQLNKLRAGIKVAFRAGEIALAHANLLAPLKADAQQLALETPGALFDRFEQLSLDGKSARKARTPIELEAWIAHHVRFDPKAPANEVLFGESIEAIKSADAKPVVSLTTEHFVADTARTDERVFGPKSWKVADGKKGRACEAVSLGVFVVGPRRGQTLEVCVNKNCRVHWPKKAKKDAKVSKREIAAKARVEADERKAKLAEARRDAWRKLEPKIRTLLVERIKPMAMVDAKLQKIVFDAFCDDWVVKLKLPMPNALLLQFGSNVLEEWDSEAEFRAFAKLIGLNLKSIDPTPAKDAPAK